MAVDTTAYYPAGAGMLSGATAGGYSGLASFGFGPAAATPTTQAAGYAPTNAKGFTANGIGFVAWTLIFTAVGLVLLHMGAER